ncbi:MAG: DUF4118 domain-containing protein [Chloroflexi bacterium]|nr:DUF4118 domain-containing protein [Chloroflexota bacterium]
MNLLTLKPKNGLVRYSIAVGVVVVSLLLKLLLSWLFGAAIYDTAPFVALSFGVLVVAWYGGLGPGMVATALTALGIDYFFLPPYYAFNLNQKADLINLILFVLEGFLISKLCQSLRKVLLQANSELNRRRQLEEDLYQQREFFAVALTSIGDAVITTDLEGRVTFMNKVAEKLTGWSQKEAEGRDSHEIFQLETTPASPETLNLVAKVLQEGKIIELTNHTSLISRDGSKISIMDSAAPIRNEKNALLGAVLVFQNVSVREQQDAREHFLADASKTLVSTLDYESMVQNVAQLAVPFLADWCIVYIRQENGSVQRLSVVHSDSTKEAQGREVLERCPFEESENHPVMVVLRTGESMVFNRIPDELFAKLTPNSETLLDLQKLGFKSAMSVPLLARGQALGVINLIFSDSGRLYNEAELILAEELARRAALAIDNARLYQKAQLAIEAQKELDQLKDNFLSIAGHELRTPLTTIKGFAQLLKRRLVTATNPSRAITSDVVLDSRLLDNINQQVDLMNKLIEEMLNVTRIQSGQLELELTPNVNLVELVSRVVEQHQMTLANQSILLEVTPQPIRVNCDESRLEQVLNNLITNAIKYSPPNQSVVVGLEIVQATTEQNNTTPLSGEAVVRVCDNGYGISKEDQPHVFQRFYRVRNHNNPKVKGLGLGLYICYEIIARHNGRMWLTSEVDKGSNFYFSLPLDS